MLQKSVGKAVSLGYCLWTGCVLVFLESQVGLTYAVAQKLWIVLRLKWKYKGEQESKTNKEIGTVSIPPNFGHWTLMSLYQAWKYLFWFRRIPDRTLGRHLNQIHSIAYRCSRLHFLNRQWFFTRSSCLIRQGKKCYSSSIMPRFTKSIKIRAYVLKVFLSCRFKRGDHRSSPHSRSAVYEQRIDPYHG